MGTVAFIVIGVLLAAFVPAPTTPTVIQSNCSDPYNVGIVGEGRYCLQVHWTDTKGRGLKVRHVRAYLQGDQQQEGFKWVDANLYRFNPGKLAHNYPRQYNADRDADWGKDIKVDREVALLYVFGEIELDQYENIPFNYHVKINGN